MTQEPISKKLTDLFELFKSGALSKEEYDQLKAQIISPEGIRKSERVTKYIQPEIGKESVIESSREEATKSPDKPTQSKKGNSLWLVSIIALVSVLAAYLIFNTSLFSKKPEIDSQKKQTVTEVDEEMTVTDIDGNIYTTVKIGTQVWMVENLRTTKYNDGTPIPFVTDNSAWRALTTPAYCWYNNDEMRYKETYGALYNWYTVNTNKLCPVGWRVPSDSDWKVLTDYLSNNGFGHQGSGYDIGKSLANTKGWDSSTGLGAVGNDRSSNNKSGFNGFASGIRFSNGEFRHSGQNAKWWSSTGISKSSAQIRFISWDDGIVASYSNRKENGFSVRCVKDIIEPESENNSTTKESYKQEERNISNTRDTKTIKYLSEKWNEDAASSLVMKDLSDNSDWYKDYQYFFSRENQQEDMFDVNHTVAGYLDIIRGKTRFKIGISFTRISLCPPHCSSPILSVFEFQQMQDGWYLTRKAKGFYEFLSGGTFKDLNFFPLSSDNYLIMVEGDHRSRGEPAHFTDVNVYAFKNDELEEIFHATNEYNDMNSRVLGFNNKIYLEIEKLGDGNSSKKYYEFNGEEFEEYRGSFTDPSLTSMDRMGFQEHADAKKTGICPTCRGTGICHMCGGTGVNNMGFECGCVRAYKTEIASGHSPSHQPKKCTRCGGTGNY